MIAAELPLELALTPIELIVLQGTSFCNLNCTYCDLSVESRRERREMTSELIERAFTDLFESGYLGREVAVIWHSGEPLTLPPSYYDNAIAQILRLRDGLAEKSVEISFDIQTNGVLINEAWCAFFKRHQAYLKVGVSCDGPADLHDAFRLNWSGGASHAKTLRGMDLLRDQGIKFGIIAVVTNKTLSDPERFFRFFHERRDALSGFHFNILAEANSGNEALSYGAGDRARYQEFYRALLELSRTAENSSEDFQIQNFTQGLARILNTRDAASRPYMVEASAPLKSLSIDARGDVTTFYAGLAPDVHRNHYGDGEGLCIGNIIETSLNDMIQSDKLRKIMHDFEVSTETCRKSCSYFEVCTGGFELTKLATHGRFDATETPECTIHVQALTDALLDDLSGHLECRQELA